MKLLVEEVLAELAGQDWELLDDAEFDAPVLVLRKVSQTRDYRLLQVFDTND